MQEFNKDIIEVVWEKGRIIEGYDPAKFRQDACGAWITRDKYGDKTSNFGWVIDHICPRSLLERHNVPEDAVNDVVNLQPMHWANDMSFVCFICSFECKGKGLIQGTQSPF